MQLGVLVERSLILINRNIHAIIYLRKTMHSCKDEYDLHKLFNRKMPCVSQYEI